MLLRIIYAVAVGVIVFLGCLLLGGILMGIPVAWVIFIGTFLRTYASLLGLLVALYSFATGRSL